MTAGLELRGIAMRFGGTQALAGIDLAVEAGRYAVLLGPSGCGKSTLLAILGGFLAPNAGRVLIGGRDVTDLPPARRPTTTVFQDYALFPHMTLAENVGFGLRMRGEGRAARHTRAEAMLALVGLEGAGGRYPDAVSGGQRQRVALARALAIEPDVLLLDEPLGALDLKLRRAMQDELKAIQTRLGTTFVHVTHDQEEAMAVADTIVVMNAGRIEEEGPPARVYLRPRSHFAAAFMGEVNMLAGTVRGGDAAGLTVETAAGTLTVPGSEPAGHGALVTLLVRPEHLREGGPLALGTATVEDLAFFGTHVRVHCRLSGLRLVAHLPQGASVFPGAIIPLTLAPEHVAILPGHPT
jgi:spermidine/putrescine transport system ATP-binding protein